MGEWISVEERLPEDGENVLVYAEWTRANPIFQYPVKGITIANYIDGKWRVFGGCRMKVSHWLPLPEPPKVE